MGSKTLVSSNSESGKVFISYSHEDAYFIAPVVKLVRGLKKGLVFQDTTDIAPGSKWQAVLDEEIQACGVFLLFWCFHTSESPEVKKEWRLALQNDKCIWPLLLDKTKLPAELSEFEWIDMTEFADHPERDSQEVLIGMDNSPRMAGLIMDLLDKII